MNNEFEKTMENLLKENGWYKVKPSFRFMEDGDVREKVFDETPEQIAEYRKEFNGSIVGMEIVLTAPQLKELEYREEGYFGIYSLFLEKYEWDMPYFPADLEDMRRVLEEAERDLCSIDIPFQPTYNFLQRKFLDSLTKWNLKLRDTYGLYEAEKRIKQAKNEANA